ncbi:MAG: ABC transporter permease, partial [Muribaculaceae bacterium]|nr:ABC transporter permease [Muribaculaceae bacterium]
PISIFSYLVPCRDMFLIYIFTGLNAFPVYYSRLYFVALLIFPFVCSLLIHRLKKACLNPVYVP